MTTLNSTARNNIYINDNDKYNDKDNDNDKNISCWEKNKKILLIVLIRSIIVILLVVLLFVFLFKKKDKNKNEFYVIGTYNAEKRIPLKLFNPSKIGLKDNNYNVEKLIKKITKES